LNGGVNDWWIALYNRRVMQIMLTPLWGVSNCDIDTFCAEYDTFQIIPHGRRTILYYGQSSSRCAAAIIACILAIRLLAWKLFFFLEFTRRKVFYCVSFNDRRFYLLYEKRNLATKRFDSPACYVPTKLIDFLFFTVNAHS